MKIAAADKNGGLETPDGRFRAKPNEHGIIDWPDSLGNYAEQAQKTDLFVIKGRTFHGCGEGHWRKNWVSESEDDDATSQSA